MKRRIKKIKLVRRPKEVNWVNCIIKKFRIPVMELQDINLSISPPLSDLIDDLAFAKDSINRGMGINPDLLHSDDMTDAFAYSMLAREKFDAIIGMDLAKGKDIPILHMRLKIENINKTV